MSSRLTEMDKSYTDFLFQAGHVNNTETDCKLLNGWCECVKPIRDCRYLNDEDEEQDV